ncbi:TerB family tellurite resistance protein [Mucilaginibacter phenanthrenivorans]|uniref:TerB family tellurite resistance protein n=1 Tax=Mucilaginibacter phenanthrenivorans TaxID=1234842 RepID=UPI0021577189|nr:TerB family tellurite resistance protein [Mucilaginibacter phenanthrenivorans]
MEAIKVKDNRRKVKGLLIAFLGACCLLLGSATPVKAQDQDMEQLILDIQKLDQFKSILTDMEKGYADLSAGYGVVKGIAQGNFNLHEVFLDGLYLVSPVVRQYVRVADILTAEERILSEYKTAYSRFAASNKFNPHELDYLLSVYNQLTKLALQNVTNLLNVMTDSKLRMSDAERLAAIDRIYRDTGDKLTFLESFNRKTMMLQMQRTKEQNENQTLKNLYGQ